VVLLNIEANSIAHDTQMSMDSIDVDNVNAFGTSNIFLPPEPKISLMPCDVPNNGFMNNLNDGVPGKLILLSKSPKYYLEETICYTQLLILQ
jgi:hypothetical protein